MRDADAIHCRSLLHYLPSLHWSALRAGYQVLHSLVFSSLEPLRNWQLTLLPLLIANSYDWYLLKGRNPKPFQVLKSWPVFTPQFPYNLPVISWWAGVNQSLLPSLPGPQVLSLLVLLIPEHSQNLIIFFTMLRWWALFLSDMIRNLVILKDLPGIWGCSLIFHPVLPRPVLSPVPYLFLVGEASNWSMLSHVWM